MKNIWNAYLAILFVSTLCLANFQTINHQIKFAKNKQLVSEESRALYRSLRHEDYELFKDDYITQYLDSKPQIIGHESIQKIFTCFGDLRKGLHRYMHLPLWILTIGSIIAIAWRIGGWQIAWASGCISISSNLFLYQMVGGVSHAFAYPILALTILLNVFGKPKGFVMLIILAGLLYPPTLPIIGINLAAYLLLLKPQSQGISQDWLFRKKIIFIGVSGAIAIALFLPFLKPTFGFGPPITSSDAFPEAQNGGRYFQGVTHPFVYFIVRFANQHHENLSSQTKLFIMALSIITIVFGFTLRDRKNIYIDRLLPFFLASTISFLLIYFIAPNFIYRYLLYPIPLIVSILLPLSFYSIINKVSFLKKKTLLIALTLSLAYSFSMTGVNSLKTGYHYELPKSYFTAYEFIETLDKKTIIAGFPGQVSSLGNSKNKISAIEYVPYFAKRNAYLTRKTHYPTHLNYTLELRKRMNKIIQIFSTKSIEDLIKFREEEKVRYLIVEPEYLKSTPKYFKPFDEQINRRWKNIQLESLQVIKQKKNAAVFEDHGIYILDLTKINR